MQPTDPPSRDCPLAPSRREFLGALAPVWAAPPPRAKHFILLLMAGGPSHIDTFDPKPKLNALHMKAAGPPSTAGRRCYIGSPFKFRRAGKLGIEINEGFRYLAGTVDDICFYRGIRAASANHVAALDHFRGACCLAQDGPAPPRAREGRATLALYGVADPDPGVDRVARDCLRARQRIEAGARFVEVTVTGWDCHQSLEESYGALIRSIDRPIAGLIQDLKQRGLFQETLIAWGGEFGRSPYTFIGDRSAWGRDHNSNAMTVWFAGAGAPRGKIIGATDELGDVAVEAVRSTTDLGSLIRELVA
jgi:hypothetical protein